MVDMKPRNVATAQIIARISTNAGISYYTYNEPQVKYNETLVTYNYYSSRGNAILRTVATPMMRGR